MDSYSPILPTEQILPGSRELHRLSSSECLEFMAQDQIASHQALKSCLGNLSLLVDECVDRYRQGGRIIYLGAGTSGRLAVLDAVGNGANISSFIR